MYSNRTTVHLTHIGHAERGKSSTRCQLCTVVGPIKVTYAQAKGLLNEDGTITEGATA